MKIEDRRWKIEPEQARECYRNGIRFLRSGLSAVGSKGTVENSPAVHCRGDCLNGQVPKGRLKEFFFAQSSLRDSFAVGTFPGVETPGYSRKVPSGLRNLNDRDMAEIEVRALLF